MSFSLLPQRIQDKIEQVTESGCWIWTGYTWDGYGRVSWRGRSDHAHRVVWNLLRGQINAETLDHLCRVRCCVNPDHMRELGRVDNVLCGEGPSARNKRKTLCDKEHPLEKRRIYPGRYCPTCHGGFQRDWQRRHPENLRLRKQRYKERHPGRALMLARDRYRKKKEQMGLTVAVRGPYRTGGK